MNTAASFRVYVAMSEFDLLMLELAACEPIEETTTRPVPPFAWTEDAIAAAFQRDARAVEPTESE